MYAISKPALRGGEPVGGTFLRVRTSDDVFLFQPATISHLLNFAGMLAQMTEMIAKFQAQQAGDWIHQNVRATAGFLCQRIPVLKADLLREGGTLPPAEPLETVYGTDLPKLPPHAFPEWKVDDL